MILMVGLGNPGTKYESNRHNIGFLAVDEIAKDPSFAPFRTKFQGAVTEGRLGSQKVLILKPQTFMNESGRSVAEACRFYKIEAQDVIVLHDDLDLPGGKIRIKTGGGHGGHNGLRSIDAQFDKNYHRVRIGIGHPGHKDRVHGYVLSDFSKTENQTWVEPLIKECGHHAPLIAEKRFADFMNKIALAVKPEPDQKESN